jgi:hypothetical protein
MVEFQVIPDNQAASQLADCIRRVTHRQIRRLRITTHDGRLRILGCVPSFHLKQQALQAVLTQLGEAIESTQFLISVSRPEIPTDQENPESGCSEGIRLERR